MLGSFFGKSLCFGKALIVDEFDDDINIFFIIKFLEAVDFFTEWVEHGGQVLKCMSVDLLGLGHPR